MGGKTGVAESTFITQLHSTFHLLVQIWSLEELQHLEQCQCHPLVGASLDHMCQFECTLKQGIWQQEKEGQEEDCEGRQLSLGSAIEASK